jgi:hypothetical protein
MASQLRRDKPISKLVSEHEEMLNCIYMLLIKVSHFVSCVLCSREVYCMFFSCEARPQLENTTANHGRVLGATLNRRLQFPALQLVETFLSCVVQYCHVLPSSERTRGLEKCCKVNLTTQVSSALYRVTRLEPKSGRTQTAHFTLPTMLHSVLSVSPKPHERRNIL